MTRPYGVGCRAEGCEKGAEGKGFCQFHRRRFEKFGDPLAGGPPRPQSGRRTQTPAYFTVHGRLKRWVGNPQRCESCGTTEAKIVDWALREDAEEFRFDERGQIFSSNLTDYIRLCRRCHKRQERAVPK